MIIIKAKRDGFRRCGVAHAAKPTEYRDGDWTAEQLAELQAEAMLHVEVIDGPDDDDDVDPDVDKPEEPVEAEKPAEPAPRKKGGKKAAKE
jgi:hypothetical protein